MPNCETHWLAVWSLSNQMVLVERIYELNRHPGMKRSAWLPGTTGSEVNAGPGLLAGDRHILSGTSHYLVLPLSQCFIEVNKRIDRLYEVIVRRDEHDKFEVMYGKSGTTNSFIPGIRPARPIPC